jgi:NADH-quinone oxidoreductase subunit G
LTAHPGRVLDSNYSLNTVDICPVGALTSTDFRFKMRVWFLKETKSICTSCATGCNTLIGSRQNVLYRQTPRENDEVNSAWMCDYGRLNFHFVNSTDRLIEPQIRQLSNPETTSWTAAVSRAAEDLKRFQPTEIAVIASGRMTNEELWFAKKLVDSVKTPNYDIVPRTGPADDLLLNSIRNPNTKGAQLLGLCSDQPGAKLQQIAEGVSQGHIKAVVALQEDLTAAGFKAADLERLGALIVMDILPNETTKRATTLLPSASFAEKRGSMINFKGRLQRLNRAIQSPGNAREDWEILRDIIQHLTGANGVYLIEDVFKQMADNVPQFQGLSLSKIGDLGVKLEGVVSAEPVTASA